MANTILLAFDFLFGCWHQNLSRPFTQSGWTYRSEVDFADKLLSAMRYQFGWHLEKSDGNSEAA
jgi:hypothetical protein